MVVYIFVRAGTIASILYTGVGARTVAPGVSGRDIVLAASIWIIGPWFLVVVYWIHSVWVVVMDVGMLGLIYCGVGARTVETGVSGRDILLAALICRT